MKPRHKRIALVVGGVVVIAIAATLILKAFNSNLVFFFTPSQIAAKEAPQGKSFRIGGMVQVGSVKREPDGVTVGFVVTDTAHNVPVFYKGALPDLFKEGKGVVAQGKLSADGTFQASEVLAKHDENYMPPEAAEAVARAHKASEKSASGKGDTPPAYGKGYNYK
jgi:cytochrome c-type biogenesis protein CcmE